MGKEDEYANLLNAELWGFTSDLSREQTRMRDRVGWMGPAPRTPLHTLIALEKASSTSGSCKSKDGSASRPAPPSGYSSPGHKMNRAGAVPPSKPGAEFLRPLQQLGTLFAQEREDQSQEPTFRSQELRYLFAKDWALQTSDEDDEFWDSGSLCGMASPSPRKCQTQRRRRRKKLNSKGRNFPPPGRPPPPPVAGPVVAAAAGPPLLLLQPESPDNRLIPHPFATPTATSLIASPKSSSLGTLLAEEIAASSLAIVEPRWSEPAVSDSSRRPKIGSLSDISAPARPESQSQLDFLVAKILTLRARRSYSDARPGDGASSTSTSIQAGEIVRVGEKEGESGIICASANSSPYSASSSPWVGAGVDPTRCTVLSLPAPNGTNLSGLEIEEALDCSSPSEFHSPGISITTDRETMDSPWMGTDAGESAFQHEVDDADELVAWSPTEDEAPEPDPELEPELDPDFEPELEPARVQLGTLLERARGEHGWLPLGRSPMGSPLTHVEVVSTDENCHQSASSTPAHEELSCAAMASPASPRSPHFGQSEQPAEDPPVELAVEAAAAAAAAASPVQEQPLQQLLQQQRPPSTQRVSLLSLLNQDMQLDLEDGLPLQALCASLGLAEEEEDEELAESEELDPMCCVCMVGHKGAAFIPCGHTFCRKCCREVRRSMGSCPLCNQAIVDVLHIY